jgi:hypothetical protein
MDEKLIPQSEVTRLLIECRRGLQQRVHDQIVEIAHLKSEIARLSEPAHNPLYRMIICELEK